ncbi:MAG TPA: XdhC/CoxI family protein [Chitinophagaceae bacterium]|nr:XdhC/CoxI family protein [Chitinophagaceae bacterium]
MKEIKDIIRSFDEAQKQDRQTALATVVHLDGSSYRRPGARMLITDEGQLTGAISGGCLEGDALRKALLVMSQQRPMLVTYDTMDEDDAKFGIGLGCNGIIQVLIEPINPAEANNPVDLLKIVAEKREKAVLVTLFSLENKKDTQPGTCLLLKENKQTARNTPLKDILVKDGMQVLQNGQSVFRNYQSENLNLTAFIELVEPAVSLIAIGAGNDVIPLIAMAEILGWETMVIDGRPAYAKKERFVSSCQVLVSKPENVISQVAIDERTVFVLMTHNYNYDMAMLHQLLLKNVTYVGMLGPKKKLDRILGELRDQGTNFTEQQLGSVHSPVGLDIGAETSEEIALSILSEIKAVLSGKQGLSLHSNTGSIHSRSELTIEQVKISEKN